VKLRTGSFCTGICAPEVAWHPLGWTPQWFSEIDPFAIAVEQHHFPDVRNLGDMTKVDGTDLHGTVDVLVAGTPCQAFSVAGKRESLDDHRGNLTLTFVELVHGIDPLCVVWENVPGVLSTDDNAFGCFLAGLVGEVEPLVCRDNSWPNAGMVVGPRRSAAWRVLDAQYHRLAQRRRRVFVVSFRSGDGRNPGAVLFEPESLPRHSPPSRETGERISPTISARTKGGGGLGTDFDCDGGLIPQSFDEYNASIGNVSATMARNANRVGSILMPVAFNWQSGGDCRINPSDDLANGLQRDQTQAIAFDTTQITSAGNYSSPQPGDPCHPLASGAHPPAVAFAIQERAVSENPDNGPQGKGWQQGTAFTLEARNKVQAVAAGGRDAQVQMREVRQGDGGAAGPCGDREGDGLNDPLPGMRPVAFQTRFARNGRGAPEEICPTLQGADAGATSDMRPCVATTMAVRRLLPIECERLQGFPDDYTLIPYRGKPAADGPRYRALGNSMAVPVLRWIGERIEKVLTAREAVLP